MQGAGSESTCQVKEFSMKDKKTVIICCRTIGEELQEAMTGTGVTHPVLWIESGLHNVPRRLHGVLQETVDAAEGEGAERILLAMGFCGNSLENLKTEKAELILPRADDCITLLLGSFRRRQQIQNEAGTYFMTKGWIEGERNIMREYEYTMEKYGEETGREIFDMMFGNYRRIGILDTGCYEMEPVLAETERIAAALQMNWERFSASNDYLKKLLTGPWEESSFVRLQPGEKLTLSHLQVLDR